MSSTIGSISWALAFPSCKIRVTKGSRDDFDQDLISCGRRYWNLQNLQRLLDLCRSATYWCKVPDLSHLGEGAHTPTTAAASIEFEDEVSPRSPILIISMADVICRYPIQILLTRVRLLLRTVATCSLSFYRWRMTSSNTPAFKSLRFQHMKYLQHEPCDPASENDRTETRFLRQI